MGKLLLELEQLWLAVSLFAVIVFLLHQTKAFREALSEQELSAHGKLLFILVFSGIGIFGTCLGIPFGDGVINTRAAGIIAGGLIGGPAVGLASGIIAGIHRLFYADTFAIYTSALVTVLQGLISGLLSPYMKKKKPFWLWAFFVGLALEGLHMLCFFVFNGASERVFRLVQVLAPSMVIINAVAVGLFIGLLEQFLSDREKAISHAAKMSFRSVSLLMNAMKSGISSASMQNVTPIVMNSLPELEWAAIFAGDRLQALTYRRGRRSSAVRESAERFARIAADALPLNVLTLPLEESENGRLLVCRRGAGFTVYEKEMVRGISRSIGTVVEFHRLKEQESLFSEAEIKVLQTQINPHFLFNALNTIGYYCRSDPKGARRLVVYLADYYRQNLVYPGTMISFAEEMRHVQAYVHIEKARFCDRLSLSCRVETDAFDVPALLLQPLVENALIHGILPKVEGGRVLISVREKGNFYRLRVCDDGVGMEREKVKDLLVEHERRTSIGLINVHKRLRSIYGAESGLHIHSRPGCGTIVSFKIPKEETAAAKHLARNK